MVLPPVDFESTAYTNFATPAGNWWGRATSYSLPNLRASGSLELPAGEVSQYSRFGRRGKIERRAFSPGSYRFFEDLLEAGIY